MAINLNQSVETFGKLVGNGITFEVPAFQRDYSWEREEWEDLWLDILAIDTEGEHFMGYILLQNTETKKHFQIIDGQQRITTLSILIYAVIFELYERGDKQRAEDLERVYLSSRDITLQRNISKLILNKNNRTFYSYNFLQFKLPKFPQLLKISEKRLYDAFLYFQGKIKEKYANDSNENLTNLITKNVDTNIYFITIYLQDDVQAFKIFETLNARGVKLSTADLFKNYLFSAVFGNQHLNNSEPELEWEIITETLVETDLTTYIKHFVSTRYKTNNRKTTLYKEIKNIINNEALKAVTFLDELYENVNFYNSLYNPKSNIWSKEETNYLTIIKLFKSDICFPLLLNAKTFLDNYEFLKVLRDVVNIIFRFVVIGGKNPRDLENVFNESARAIYKREITKAIELYKTYLNSVFIKDEEFKNDFANCNINTNKDNQLAKYILSKIELNMSGVEPNINSKTLSIEHILPQHPNSNWFDNFDKNNIEHFVFRIGNLTLLETSKNQEIARESFEIKQKAYKISKYKMTQNLDDIIEWNSTEIQKRQKEMSNIAATIWKINY